MAATPRVPREVKYAEGLGLNSVFEELQGVEKDLGVQLEAQNTVANGIRDIERSIEDREWEVTVELRGAQDSGAFKSLAAEERAVKEALREDEIYVQRCQYRDEQREFLSNVEIEVRIKTLAHRSLTARLQELGGYFEYLAACKSARTTALAESYPV